MAEGVVFNHSIIMYKLAFYNCVNLSPYYTVVTTIMLIWTNPNIFDL